MSFAVLCIFAADTEEKKFRFSRLIVVLGSVMKFELSLIMCAKFWWFYVF